jgi:hypothetical protein
MIYIDTNYATHCSYLCNIVGGIKKIPAACAQI